MKISLIIARDSGTVSLQIDGGPRILGHAKDLRISLDNFGQLDVQGDFERVATWTPEEGISGEMLLKLAEAVK